jgi:hypothetical protein
VLHASLFPSSGYLTNVSRCLADDFFVFHCDLSCVFALDRIGSPLRDTHLATTRDLWPAVTINVIVRGDFGGQAGLEHNEIAEAYPEPDFITEFRNKLRQRRWIETGSVCFFKSHTTSSY